MGVGPPGDETSTYTHSVYQAALSYSLVGGAWQGTRLVLVNTNM